MYHHVQSRRSALTAGTAAAAALLFSFGSHPLPSQAAFSLSAGEPMPQSANSDALEGADKITSGEVKSTGDIVTEISTNASNKVSAIGSTASKVAGQVGDTASGMASGVRSALKK